MTLNYEFGGDDYTPGEPFAYQVSDTTAFKDYLQAAFPKEAKAIWEELGEYIDVRGFLADSEDYFMDMYENDAEEEWRDMK